MAAASGAIMAGMSINQGIQDSANKRLSGKIQAQVAESNARFAEIQSEDAIRRGGKAESEYRGQAARVISDQRTSFAGQGVQVNTGTAAAIQDETAIIAEEQALQIRSNAWREAWGYKVQAQGYSSAGKFAQMSANNDAKNSLITGGMRGLEYGAQSWDAYDKRAAEKKKNGDK